MERLYSQTKMNLLAQVHESVPGLLHDYPLSLFLSELQSHNNLLHPLSFSKKQLDRFNLMKAKYGIAGIAAYQKLALASLICDFWEKEREKSFPAEIVSNYRSWFERVYEDFSRQPDFYYDIENEFWPLSHDLAICSGRCIPIGGAWFIERRMLPRKIMTLIAQEWHQDRTYNTKIAHKSLHKPLAKLLKHVGLYEAINRIFAISPQLFGGSWCYIIHTAERNIKDFNSENMSLAYKNIAELLRFNKSIWGVFRESWFLDPELKEISPNLAFLWETPLSKGARLYYGGPCNAYDLKRALLLSPVRNKMYKEGTYIPRTYFYFWPRQDMIEGCRDM